MYFFPSIQAQLPQGGMEEMFSLLLIPATLLTVAYFYRGKEMSDKKKIATFLKLQRSVFSIKGNYNIRFS